MPSLIRVVLAAAVAATGLLLPTATAAAAPVVTTDFGPWIDGYASWDSTEGTGCSSVVQPGVTATISLLRSAYPTYTSYGTLRSCSSSTTSGHEEGRALDWVLNAGNTAQRAVADDFLAWLLATDAHGNRHAMARRMGVMYIIWNGRMWRAYDSDPAKPWRTYTGSSPHTDHIHISFSWAGARAETSFFTGGGCLPGDVGCNVRRLWGSDRYATAEAIARETRPDQRSVVIASGEQAHLVDGLVGAPLAASADAPVLLVRGDSIPAATLTELRRRAADRAYVLGGPAAVGADVADQLAAEGIAVTRLAGADRFVTAEQIARELSRINGGAPQAFVTPFWDSQLPTSLMVGGVAAAIRAPILLTRADYVPPSTAQTLDQIGVSQSFAVSYASPLTDTILASLPGGERIHVADLPGLSVAVADRFRDDADAVVLASAASANVVDALPGGALGQPVLLTSPTSLSGAVGSWLDATSTVELVTIVGGPGAVSDAVARQASTYVN